MRMLLQKAYIIEETPIWISKGFSSN